MGQYSKGDKVCISSGLNLRNGPCGTVLFTSTGREKGTVDRLQAKSCSFGTYTWVNIKLDDGRQVWGAHETGLIYKCGGGSGQRKDNNVYMVHQRWDTADSFGGNWACGPTSAVMALTFFRKLTPHRISCSYPTPHTNDYGWYVSNTYTSPTGHVFNRFQSDSNGKPASGAYGWCTEDGMAWAWRIQQYVEKHGLKTQFLAAGSYSFDKIKQSIDEGKMVVLSTQLTSSGHLILVKGYDTRTTPTVIANDPWGNANLPGYGKSMNGANVEYTWQFVKPKWCVIIGC